MCEARSVPVNPAAGNKKGKKSGMVMAQDLTLCSRMTAGQLDNT